MPNNWGFFDFCGRRKQKPHEQSGDQNGEGAERAGTHSGVARIARRDEKELVTAKGGEKRAAAAMLAPQQQQQQ